ncbi:MAG: acyl carrier protein [Gammaproteobacteria bacterium]|nr:acyl carrier protein [Gammaproteobacteria bacterium]
MSSNALTKEQIFAQIKLILVEMFEIDAAKIKPEAHLYHDLDVDSIDAVDLIVELKKRTGKKVKPDDFKEVRTLQDVVDVIHGLAAE